MTSYLFLAEGFEETEAIATVDIMRRAGMKIRTVSITSQKRVVGAHGIAIEADNVFKEVDFEDAEWLICPGGMPGAENLHNFGALNDLLRVHHMHPGKIAAICAAPAVVLAPIGLLDGVQCTCYPGFESQCKAGGAIMMESRVVVSNNIVTANGPSSAMPFALAIVATSLGDQAARSVAEGLLLKPGTTPYYF